MKTPATAGALGVLLLPSSAGAQRPEHTVETPTHGRSCRLSEPASTIRAVLLVVGLAGLLASNLVAAPQTASPEGQAAAMGGQEAKQGGDGDLATIIQSPSTNTRGYKVVIHKDGSATAEIGSGGFTLRVEPPRSQQFPAGTIDTKTLRRLLTEVGDVSRIPTGVCAKSVSFGTRTQISYGGRTSGDLQCIRQQAEGDEALLQASEDLARFVQTTLRQLKIDSRRLSSNP